jgi:hypothetical protein
MKVPSFGKRPAAADASLLWGIARMLLMAFYVLSAAVVMGLGLSLFYVGLIQWRSWIVAALHGVIAAAGLGILVFALRGPAHGFSHGVQSFGEIAAILAAATLVFGCIFLFFPRVSRRGWLIGAHATLGIAAYVFLSGYVLLG